MKARAEALRLPRIVSAVRISKLQKFLLPVDKVTYGSKSAHITEVTVPMAGGHAWSVRFAQL